MIARLIRRFNHAADALPPAPLALALRLAPAVVFWRSGRTKVEGLFSISDSTFFLFREEYTLPVLPPDLAARLATLAEHVFPVLLLIGLLSRLSALALLMMTAVIQVFVYPSAWPTHALWAACLLAVIARGPGQWSADRMLGLERE